MFRAVMSSRVNVIVRPITEGTVQLRATARVGGRPRAMVSVHGIGQGTRLHPPSLEYRASPPISS